MRVQKRRPSREEVELQAVIDVAQQLLHRWPTYVAAEAALAAPTLRASGGGNGRSSDVPDPTYAIVSSLDRYTETREAIPGALGQLRWIQARMQQALLHHPDIARARDAFARDNRCSGEVDATCMREREPGRTLCSTCRKAKQRAVPASDLPVSPDVPADLLDSARVEASTPKQGGAYSSARVTCMSCRREYDVPHGVDSRVWLAEHHAKVHAA